MTEAIVEFDVFSDKWDAMSAWDKLLYCEKYYAWLLLGNKPIVSMSGDGLSTTYGLAEVEKLLKYLRENALASGYMTSMQLRPNYFV